MLRTLQIHNLALIESLELSLANGFTCLTGETGAGKSILLDAVGLLLGVRASTEWIRTGAEKALVEGVFDLSEAAQAALAPMLQAQGIDLDDAQLIISRELSASGKTVARINGRIVTVQCLRDTGRHLAHQYGQHDSTLLLKREEHLTLLDRFGHVAIRPLRERYDAALQARVQAVRELEQAEQGEKERAQKNDMLQFQIKEIAAAHVKPGEEERLRHVRSRLQHVERLRSVVDDVYQRVYDGDARGSAILADLYKLISAVDSALQYDDGLAELREYLDVARVNLSEAAEFTRHYREEMEFEPERLQRLEDRLATLEKLLKKYGETTHEVLQYADAARTQLHDLENHDERMASLKKSVQHLSAELQSAADALSNARKTAAIALQMDLKAALSQLMMPQVELTVAIERVQPRSDGTDEVEILFGANRGEELKPLSKIASGGELSRVMLAFAQVLAVDAPIQTLIFDEIDTGISGRAAQAVAERMAAIADNTQVLCVTHLPQMASKARHHLLIEKQTDNERTRTFVRPLIGDERVLELAKMISGEHVTEKTREHALEMLERSQIE